MIEIRELSNIRKKSSRLDSISRRTSESRGMGVAQECVQVPRHEAPVVPSKGLNWSFFVPFLD